MAGASRIHAAIHYLQTAHAAGFASQVLASVLKGTPVHSENAPVPKTPRLAGAPRPVYPRGMTGYFDICDHARLAERFEGDAHSVLARG